MSYFDSHVETFRINFVSIMIKSINFLVNCKANSGNFMSINLQS